MRHGAINSILTNYQILISTMEAVQQGHDEYAAKANGLLHKLESFDTYFGLRLAALVYAPAETFSMNLQAKDTLVSEALKGSKFLVQHYASLRNDAAFAKFYQDVLNATSDLTNEPMLPRFRKAPRRLDGCSQPHRYGSPEDKINTGMNTSMS